MANQRRAVRRIESRFVQVRRRELERVPGFEEKAIYDFGERGSMIVATATGTYDSTGKVIATGDTRSIQNFGKTTYAAVMGRGVSRCFEWEYPVSR
jgi:hypothetical protein